MSFSRRDLRRGVDVFSADNVYLGTVVWVRWEGVASASPPGPSPVRGGRDQDNLVSPPLSTRERPGGGASPAPFSGERLGPMPTAALGNGAPVLQTVSNRYASESDRATKNDSGRPTELVIVRSLVSLNWDTLRPVIRRVPVELIQLVSLERIILSVTATRFMARPRTT